MPGQKFKITTGISVLLLFLFSCKKESLQPAQSATVKQSDTANYIYGWLRKYEEYNYTHGKVNHTYKNSFGCAYFSSTPVKIKGFSVVNYQNGGTIFMNEDSLIFTTNNYYKDIILNTLHAPVTWQVNGNSQNSFPAFNTVCGLPFPVYTNYKNMPKVIERNQDLTLEFSGTSNTKRIQVIIYSGSQFVKREIFAAGGTITFEKADIAYLLRTQSGYIDLYFYNEEIKIINNKNYRFSNVTRELISNIFIVN